jgi:hypothetical protein
MAKTLPRSRGGASLFSPENSWLSLFLGLVIACGAHTIQAEGRPIEGVPSPGNSASASSTWCVAEPLRSTETTQGVVGSLANLNTQFLQAHARARTRQCADLESNRLVLRYSFGLFEARFRGQEVTRTSILPKEYHPVKDVSHAVYLAALLFAEPPGVERDRHVVQALAALSSVLSELRDPTSLTATLLPPSLHDRQSRLLQRTLDAVGNFSLSRLGPDGQRSYFESVRGDLKDNLRDIAIASLQVLHSAVELTRTKVTKVDPKAWDSALVVVGVMHQARAREIGIQYFERLLDERVSEGARNERRLVVAEHMTATSEQLGLLSAHLVDEEGATAVFADPLRLQWDALGDIDPATLDVLFHH